MTNVQTRLDGLDREVERLGRIDVRLNKELVQKPYLYIDKVKNELSKENADIQKVINSNNEKYIHKIVNTEHKVNKVLTDTEALIHLYHKNVKDLNGKLESTKTMREQMNV